MGALHERAKPAAALAWTTARETPSQVADPLAGISGLAPKEIIPAAFSPSHDQSISSVSIVLNKPLKDTDLDQWLGKLLQSKGPDLLRVKGVVFLQGIEKPSLFHGVQHVFDPPVPLMTWTGDDRRSRIVVIGRNLDHEELKQGLTTAA